MNLGTYILVDGKPVAEPDMQKWSQWMKTAERAVGKTKVGEAHVSTVFLGLDHSFGNGSEPVLWETMIFGGEHDQYQERYTSLDEAKAGHERAVEMARVSEEPPSS